MANIFAEFAQPVRSVQDYQNDYDKQALVRGQLVGQTRINELSALQADQQRQTIGDTQRKQNALRMAVQAAGPNADPNNFANSLLKNPDTMDAGVALQKHLVDIGHVTAQTQRAAGTTPDQAATTIKTGVETAGLKQAQQIKDHEQYLQGLSSVNSYDDAVQWAINGRAAGTGPMAGMPAEQFLAGLQRIPKDPAALGQWKQQAQMGGMSLIDQMKFNKPDANSQLQSDTALTGQQSVASTALAGQRSVAQTAANSLAQKGQQFGVEQGNLNLRAGMNPDGSIRGMATDGSGKIDLAKVAPEDLAAAYRYKADGTLPPNMGRGAQGAAESRRLRAVASALDDQAGESPEDARIRQLALMGDVTAVNQMRRREVAVGANVKNFDFNADQVIELSKKVDRSGVPIVNAWINAGRRSLTGNPELSAFDVAVKTTVNEFAQIVSGTTAGATTEGEKKKAEQLLNAQQTPEQIIAVINQMRVESQNRMKSFADQRKQSMPTNRAGGSPAAPAGAPPPATTGSGATVSKW